MITNSAMSRETLKVGQKLVIDFVKCNTKISCENDEEIDRFVASVDMLVLFDEFIYD